MQKRVCVISLAFFWSWISLVAFDMKVVSSVQEVTNKRIVWLRCRIEDGELGLLSREISFYTNDQRVQVSGWRIDKQPDFLAVPVLSKVRSMYSNTFVVAVSLQSGLTDADLEQVLPGMRLYLAGLVLKNNTIKKHWFVAPLLAVAAIAWHNTSGLTGSATTELLIGSGCPIINWKKTASVWLDFVWLDAITHVIKVLSDVFHLLNHWIFLLLLAFYLFWRLRRKYYGVSTLISAGLLGLCTLHKLSAVFGVTTMYVLIAMWLLLCAWYIRPVMHRQILGQLNDELFTLLVICVLPCLVKSILLCNGL
jgi:hypothetical protein